MRNYRYFTAGITYEDLIGEPLIKIPLPKEQRLQLSTPNLRVKYMRHLEDIFGEQNI